MRVFSKVLIATASSLLLTASSCLAAEVGGNTTLDDAAGGGKKGLSSKLPRGTSAALTALVDQLSDDLRTFKGRNEAYLKQGRVEDSTQRSAALQRLLTDSLMRAQETTLLGQQDKLMLQGFSGH